MQPHQEENLMNMLRNGLGTLETGGTIRVSPNIFTEISEIDTFLGAIEEFAGGV